MSIPQTTITFLGTASAVPGARHDTASFIINGKYLVDTGWYAAIRMLEYSFNPMDLEYLFFTHCHHDHYIGLPHLLFYLRMRRREFPDHPPLKIVGPAEDVEKVITLAHRFLQTDRFPELEQIPEIIPLNPGESYQTEAFRIDTCATIHPVQGLCYKFTDKASGAVLGFTGDSAYYPPIAEHLKGVTFLIHEASHGAENPEPGSSSGHSGALQAAAIAQTAEVHLLALIHCPEKHAQAALTAAQRIFSNTIFPADGQTVRLTANGAVSPQVESSWTNEIKSVNSSNEVVVIMRTFDITRTQYKVSKKAKQISKRQISAIRQAAENLEKKDVPANVIEAIARGTTDLSSRKTLFKYLQDTVNHA